MLKRGSKLRRSRQPARQYEIDSSHLVQRPRDGSRENTERSGRVRLQPRVPTVEMEEAKEEVKEGSRLQRSATSGLD